MKRFINPNGPAATLRQVALAARVAPSTVSTILSGKGRISVQTRARVLAAARSLDYRPNRLARGLRVRQTGSIGLLIPSVSNPFFTALARGAEDAAFAAGHDLLLCNSDRDPSKERQYVVSLTDKWVDALILAAPMLTRDEIISVRERCSAVVVMNCAIDDDGIDEIHIDYREAAKSLVQHLLDLGHRRIGFVGGPMSIDRFRHRFEGYRDMLRRRRLYREEHVRLGGYDHDTGYTLGQALIIERTELTALFCANDMIAIGALAAMADLGLRVPADISIGGFDDIPFASLVRPRLTTVYQPSYEAGRTAIGLALTRISNGQRTPRHRIELATSLVARDSTRAPRRGIPGTVSLRRAIV